MQIKDAREKAGSLEKSVSSVIRGQSRALRWLVAALIGDGHVLLEDMPGTGKTTMAKALARSLNCCFSRIQFTPDLLPTDILGVSTWDPGRQSFNFHPGPIFASILLADEINRASPRTQSALLEAMAESQVTIEGKLHQLNEPFFVVATQNPVESQGTYPLPEAQMDRFALKFALGYLSVDQETELLNDQAVDHPLDRVEALLSAEDVMLMRQAAKEVDVSEVMRRYIAELSAASRKARGVLVGASPRASLSLMRCARALAMMDGCSYLLPDHVQELAVASFAHRLILDPQAAYSGLSGQGVVEALLEEVAVPV